MNFKVKADGKLINKEEPQQLRNALTMSPALVMNSLLSKCQVQQSENHENLSDIAETRGSSSNG